MNTLNTLLSQLIKSYVGPAILHLFIWIKKTIRMSVDCEVIDSNFIGYVCKFLKKEKRKTKQNSRSPPTVYLLCSRMWFTLKPINTII